MYYNLVPEYTLHILPYVQLCLEQIRPPISPPPPKPPPKKSPPPVVNVESAMFLSFIIIVIENLSDERHHQAYWCVTKLDYCYAVLAITAAGTAAGVPSVIGTR